MEDNLYYKLRYTLTEQEEECHEIAKNLELLYKPEYLLEVTEDYIIRQYTIGDAIFYVHKKNNKNIKICKYRR